MNEDVKPTKKCNFIISLIGIGLLCLVVGYLVGIISLPRQPKKPLPLLDKEQIIQQTKDEIKSRLIEGRVINPEPEEIFALGGTVKEVGENYLVVVPSIKQNPFGDIFPEKVKILVDKNTKIEKWTLKSPEEYEKDRDQNPSPYDKESAQLNDLNPDYFIILAKSENNIKGLNEFTATEINFSIENPFE